MPLLFAMAFMRIAGVPRIATDWRCKIVETDLPARAWEFI